MQEWKTLDRRTVFRAGDGAYLSVEYHRVQLPDGRQIEDWPWVITPDYVNVVAETVDGRLLCFRQTKYAADAVGLAIVGGYIDAGEEPLASARRELLEETGYTAPSWMSLGSYAVDGNRGCGVAHFFLATGAVWTQPVDADDLEEQELLLLTREVAGQALADGQFRVLPWASALSLALLRLQGRAEAS